MRRDAESALDGLSAGSGFRCAALVLRGYSFLLGGDADRADPIFAQAVDVGLGTSVPGRRGDRACRAWLLRARPRRLARGRELRRGGALGRATVRPRRLHGERARVHLGGARCASSRRCRTGTRRGHTGGAAAAAAHLRASHLLSAHAGRARPHLSRPRGHRRRTGGPAAGARHLAEATRSGRASQGGRRARVETRHDAYRKASARRRSPLPSFGSYRSCPLTSRTRRSAPGSTSPGTR